MARMLIAPPALAAIERRALAALPAECCGLLLGHAERGGTARVGRVVACENRAAGRSDRFTIAPEALLAAYRSARERGERVLGTYHSHPRAAAVPSELDRESAWPGASYLIVGLAAGEVRERRSWRLSDRGFVEEELVLLPARVERGVS